MIEREIGKPIPIPASLVVKKLSNSRGRVAGSTPGPLSSTAQHTVSGSDNMVRTRILRSLDSAIACIALLARFTITC
jgi:hypothetical protein